jgi:hypothetical protein
MFKGAGSRDDYFLLKAECLLYVHALLVWIFLGFLTEEKNK